MHVLYTFSLKFLWFILNLTYLYWNLGFKTVSNVYRKCGDFNISFWRWIYNVSCAVSFSGLFFNTFSSHFVNSISFRNEFSQYIVRDLRDWSSWFSRRWSGFYSALANFFFLYFLRLSMRGEKDKSCTTKCWRLIGRVCKKWWNVCSFQVCKRCY